MELFPLLVLVGPTAVGKSSIGIKLSQKLHGEIISADSMQIYKQLDIGTAKITSDETQGIVHHLINIKEPWENFSVAEFQQLVEDKIIEINKRNNISILLGGTGLYINSIIKQYSFTPTNNDTSIREELWRIVEQQGIADLIDRLSKVDPISADKIHPNDSKRIIRALEVYYSTGKPISFFANQEKSDKYNLCIMGLTMERKLLYERINFRVDLMLQNGWLEEVERLLSSGIEPHSPGLQGLGYKQLVMYLTNQLSFEEAVELIKRNTRRYAKRQITWFKRDPRIYWVDITDKEENQIIKELLNHTCRTIKDRVE